jgi:hypothetical protein
MMPFDACITAPDVLALTSLGTVVVVLVVVSESILFSTTVVGRVVSLLVVGAVVLLPVGCVLAALESTSPTATAVSLSAMARLSLNELVTGGVGSTLSTLATTDIQFMSRIMTHPVSGHLYIKHSLDDSLNVMPLQPV